MSVVIAIKEKDHIVIGCDKQAKKEKEEQNNDTNQ